MTPDVTATRRAPWTTLRAQRVGRIGQTDVAEGVPNAPLRCAGTADGEGRRAPPPTQSRRDS